MELVIQSPSCCCLLLLHSCYYLIVLFFVSTPEICLFMVMILRVTKIDFIRFYSGI
ncbi:hypothetical protein BVRB_6g145950 [Beta vulgaris subsp. vulgaris]|nr:hypothetical protein BVRB_6g145950 [Beta vulgaris subsp. vulgaris]